MKGKIKVNLLPKLPIEASIVRNAIISFDNTNKLDLYYNFEKKELTLKGQRIVKSMIEGKHKSVFFHDFIAVKMKDYCEIESMLSKEQKAGFYFYYKEDYFFYKFTIWSALSIIADSNLQIFKVLIAKMKEKLVRDCPYILQVWRNMGKPFQLSDKESEKIEIARAEHFSLSIDVPFFVANQLKRHQLELCVNEVSRRYVKNSPKYWYPQNNKWRKQSDDKKQGSLENQFIAEVAEPENYSNIILRLDKWYKQNTTGEYNICSEQVRAILPQSAFTSFVWSGSLWAFARVCSLRLKSDTQKETRDVAKMIYNICKDRDPNFDDLISLQEKL